MVVAGLPPIKVRSKMEVRDTQDQLRTILQSLRIGVSDDGNQTSSSSTPPSLPLSDQLRLLSAHIDTIKNKIAETALSEKGRQQIEQQSNAAVQVEKQAKEIEEKIQRLENDKVSTKDGKTVENLHESFTRSIKSYLSARQSFENQKELTKVASALHEAVSAVENLETRILSGRLDANGLRDAISLLKTKCSRLGIRAKEDEESDTQQQEGFEWLGKTSSAAPILQQLEKKLNQLTTHVDEILKRAWHQCVQFSYSDERKEAKLTISAQTKVDLNNTQIELNLGIIAQTLQDRSELSTIFNSFSQGVLSDIFRPMLHVKEGTIPENWHGSNAGETWHATNNLADQKSNTTLEALASLFTHLKQHLFNDSITTGSLSDLQFQFSRIVIPAIIPLLIKFLKTQLPQELLKSSNRETMRALIIISDDAKKMHDVMNTNGFLTGGLQEEGEELLDFANCISKYFLRNLAAISKANARNLLLKVANGGWEGVEIEMEVEVVHPSPVAQIQFSPEKSSKQIPSIETSADAEDEDWSAWDETTSDNKNVERRQSRKFELEARTNPLIASTPLSQRSASPASVTSNKARQKKSALGGVRVVKPQDQLGSGPFPSGSMIEGLDESSWGFDEGEEPVAKPNTSSHQTTISNSTSTSLVNIADDDEDAWFQDDVGHANISNTSSLHPTLSSTVSVPPPVPAAEDDEGDAWFQEDDNKMNIDKDIDVAHQHQETTHLPPSTTSYEVPHDEEDAWFQEEGDKNVKVAAEDVVSQQHHQSSHLPPTQHQVVPPPPEDDAWFQDEESPSVPATTFVEQEHQVEAPARSIAHDTPVQENLWFQEEENDVSEQKEIPNIAEQPSSAIPSSALEEESWFQDEIPTKKDGVDAIKKVAVLQHNSISPGPDTGDTALIKDATSTTAAEEQPEIEFKPLEEEVPRTSSIVKPSESEGELVAAEPNVTIETGKSATKVNEESKQALGSGNSQSSSNDDASWLHEDISPMTQSQNASNASLMKKVQPLNETISQSSSLSSPAIIDHIDLDEDIDEDAWGLTEEEKVERAAKRASMRASRGGPDLAAAFKAFASEKEGAETSTTRSAGPSTVTPLIDLTEEEEPETSNLKAEEESLPKLQEPSLQTSASIPPVIVEATIQKETCMISQRSIEFVKLVSSLFEDIVAIKTEIEKYAGLPVKYLIEALDDILDLHRALMPVGHAETLNNVPTLAAQFMNDCTYIARELVKLDERWQEVCQTQTGVKSEDEEISLSKHARLTVLLGQRSFDAQILVQQRVLADCLVSANGFTSTYDDQRFQMCKRAIRQVITVLQQLHSSWKSVFTASTHQVVMGKLIDSVLRRILRDITVLEDISEVEGEKLSELVKSFGELEDIFRSKQDAQMQLQEGEQAHSDVAIYVPSWFKATYLSDILTGSLVDIEFLYFEAGALVDYTKEELISLIRALFSDTPKRSKLIERMQSSV